MNDSPQIKLHQFGAILGYGQAKNGVKIHNIRSIAAIFLILRIASKNPRFRAQSPPELERIFQHIIILLTVFSNRYMMRLRLIPGSMG
jgi:hypothetical protein